MTKRYDLGIYRWALVTGASSGIGREFAFQLAKRGLNLILIGRNLTALTEVADEIHKISNSSVVILQADLTKDLDMILDNTSRFNIDLLVNNAGFGLYGDFFSNSLDDYVQMIELNISSLTKLTHYYGSEMAKRECGGIINVASVAGFFPIPHLAVYGATKAYVYNLSMSLWAELKSKNVHVLCVAPGPTETKFFERAKMETNGKLMKPELVVAGALRAFEKGKPLYIPGFGNKMTYYFVRKFFGDKFIAEFLAKYF
ncbi:SDR family oxidoreductase [Fervidobacterium pennivorans subsp. shakshaketiis]|uniref:SDR family NAD(P)-dependent oxidoreductase n=1 Tax=Fervidobacterium pennivorans TaxID=93466 RepID=UPI00355B5E3D